jgi:hypothetical protein
VSSNAVLRSKLTPAEAYTLARERLIQLFDHTLSTTSHLDPTSITSIPAYSSSALQALLSTAHSTAADKYQDYLHRRRSGGQRELFPTVQHAHEWLWLAACVKYVDGSWVSGILIKLHSVVRNSAKMAWQVISEEFGDGDLAKNHVHVYHHLIDTLGLGGRDAQGHALTGDIRGFDGLRDDQGVPRCWSAAVAQQCIGLLAPEFFPESLGFNMAYETLPYHLLVTSYELRELKIDDSYFSLHITIDNPHSGHAAMARLAVETYLESLEGDERQVAWKRVQAGMVLAEGLPTTPWSPTELEFVDKRYRPKTVPLPPSPLELEVADLFLSKSTAGRGMHCPSRLRIKGLSLEEWLDPRSMTPSKSVDFVRALSSFRPLVARGKVEESRLLKEMEWGGRMFGAFSNAETAIVRRWIVSLGDQSVRKGTYIAMTGRPADQTTMSVNTDHSYCVDAHQHGLPVSDMDGAASVWFASLLLLDHFPLSPPQLATPLGMSILRVLRAQLGFSALHRRQDICAGLDDYQDGRNPIGLWEMGEKIFGMVVDEDSAIAMMSISLRGVLDLRYRPYANQAVLIGLSLGFLGMQRHPSIAGSIDTFDVPALDRIEAEQKEALDACIEDNKGDDLWLEAIARGRRLAKQILGNTAG